MSTTTSRMSFVAVVVLCGFAAAAVDEDAGHGLVGARVVVVGAADRLGEVEVVGAALRAGGLVVLGEDERRGLDGDGDDDDGDREQARAHLMAARAAWRQLDVDVATTEARLAIDEALRLARPDEHLDLFADALVFAAALRLNDDIDDGEGRRLLRLAARLEPQRAALDPALHPPSRVQAWARARDDNAAADTAVVVVRPRAIGGDVDVEVLVDGVVVAPQGGLLQLARGPHLLTVRGENATSHSRIVDVDGDGDVIDDVVQRRDNISVRAALVTRLRGGDATVMPALLAATDTDLLVALDVDGGHLGLRRAGDVRPIPADPAEPAAFARAVVALFDGPITTTTTNVPAPALDEDGAPMWLAPTVLSIVGLVVVGTGAVLTWQLWSATEQKPPPRPVVVTCCVQ